MHDRRIDGKTAVFGNASSLYMSAMTWWDHETESIWSQPWGRAIQGTHKGVALFLLPSQLTTWASWRTQHPNTLVMIDDIELMPNLRQTFRPDFVLGIVLDGQARAYRYDDVVAQQVINDTLPGETAVVIYAADQTVRGFVRQTSFQQLTFVVKNGRVQDLETESIWDLRRGLAIDGELRGQVLPALPGMTAFEDHWFDFYPQSDVWKRDP